MIKRLIFDVDNTLIMWKDEYDMAIHKALNNLNYKNSLVLCKEIDKAEQEYEIGKKNFNRNDMLEFINKKIGQKLPESFIDEWVKELCYCVPEKLEKETYEVLEYLNKKYELVILTNWFIENQIERLKKVNILKYFSKIYSAEKLAKPYKEAFIDACREQQSFRVCNDW